jgi:DNA-directed RNA polymerase II subunit RPB1
MYWTKCPPTPHSVFFVIRMCLSRYDGTVRNSVGNVIQFLYGEDGMDGTAIESQKLENLRMSDAKFHETYRYDLGNPNFNPDWLDPEVTEKLRSSVEARQLIDSEYEVRGRAWPCNEALL